MKFLKELVQINESAGQFEDSSWVLQLFPQFPKSKIYVNKGKTQINVKIEGLFYIFSDFDREKGQWVKNDSEEFKVTTKLLKKAQSLGATQIKLGIVAPNSRGTIDEWRKFEIADLRKDDFEKAMKDGCGAIRLTKFV